MECLEKVINERKKEHSQKLPKKRRKPKKKKT